MENVFNFRDQLVTEYSNFSRSFSKIYVPDVLTTVEREYSEGRYWPEPLIQLNPNYRRSARVQELTAWAQDPGYSGPLFLFNLDRCAELGACYASLHGLTRDELCGNLNPAEVRGNDCPCETFRVLKNCELREFGKYSIQRLVLAACDALE